MLAKGGDEVNKVLTRGRKLCRDEFQKGRWILGSVDGSKIIGAQLRTNIVQLQ